MSTEEVRQRQASTTPSTAGEIVPVHATLPATVPPPAPARLRRRGLLGAVLLALAAAGGGAWYWQRLQQAQALPPGIASANGRIEAEQVDIATKYAGRIEAVLVDEGAMVTAGQVLARM